MLAAPLSVGPERVCQRGPTVERSFGRLSDRREPEERVRVCARESERGVAMGDLALLASVY